MRPIDRTLKAWAKETRAKLDPEIRTLINQANHDLYFGPLVGEEGYPGFTTACARILDAMGEVPVGGLYMSEVFEGWQEEEPSPEVCSECDGLGMIGDDTCDTCECVGEVEPCWEDWYQVSRDELMAELVGKELSKYI